MEEISDIKGCLNCSALEAWCWSPNSNAGKKSINTSNVVSTLSSRSKNEVILIFAKALEVRECSHCQAAFSETFSIPDMWWTEYCRKANGYFGLQDIVDNDSNTIGTSTWFRLQVKRVDMSGAYTWTKFNIFTQWLSPTGSTAILVFDPKPALRKLIPSLIFDDLGSRELTNPFWPYPRILEGLVRLQEDAVWLMRDQVRNIERVSFHETKPQPNYRQMHNLSRHSIHITETLELASTVIEHLIKHHGTFQQNLREKVVRQVAKSINDRFLFYEQILANLRLRAVSNKDRLSNEIGLSFNMVSQFDSNIAIAIGRMAQRDSAAMKTIAFLTLVFLPATFVSAIFSMSFFNFDADSGIWRMSDKFWIYWAVAIPLTILTAVLWHVWGKMLPSSSSSGRNGLSSKHDNELLYEM